jgi:hypothetical protein
MTSRERIKAALAKGRALTVKGLAKAIDVDSLTSLAVLCQQMTVDGTLSRTKDGHDAGGRGAVYLYKLASSPAAPVDASGTDSHGARPPSEDAARADRVAAEIVKKLRPTMPPSKPAAASVAAVTTKKYAISGELQPGTSLELAAWDNGAIEIVRGNESFRLQADEVDRVKRFLARMYDAARATG